MKVNVRHHALAALPARKDLGTYRIGCWVGLKAVMNGLEKVKFSQSYRDCLSPNQVTIPMTPSFCLL
jgi:hypothetical protein